MNSRRQEKHEIAYNIIIDIGIENLLNYFQQRLGEPKTLTTRSILVEAYARLAGIKAIPDLVEISKDSNEQSDVRIAAIQALGTLKAKEAIDVLIGILYISDSYLKIAAIRALSKIGDSSVVKPIIKLLDDDQTSVISAAVETLVSLRAKESVSKLRDVLKSGKLDTMTAERVHDFVQSVEWFMPAELIPDVAHFVGRETEVEILCNALEDKSVVSIVGMAGIGKTSLAAHVARLVDADHKLWLRCGHLKDIDDLYRELAHQLAAVGETAPLEYIKQELVFNSSEMRKLLTSALFRQKNLLVFDDFHVFIKDSEILNFLRYLANRPNLKIIVISRTIVELPEIYQVSLAGLTPTEAEEFIISKNLGLNKSEIVRVLDITQGLPLGLKLALSRIETYGKDALKDITEQDFKPLSYFIEQELKQLDAKEVIALYILSIFDTAISPKDKGVFNVFESEGIDRPSQILAGLNKYNFSGFKNNKFYFVHPIFREIIASKIDFIDFKRLNRKVGEYYLKYENDALLAASYYNKSGDTNHAIEILFSNTFFLTKKIEKESDIEKIGNYLAVISDVSMEVGTKVVESLNLNNFQLKIKKESDIEKIGTCISAIIKINNRIGITFLNKIIHGSTGEIRASRDPKAMRKLLDNVRGIDKETARKLEEEIKLGQN